MMMTIDDDDDVDDDFMKWQKIVCVFDLFCFVLFWNAWMDGWMDGSDGYEIREVRSQ